MEAAEETAETQYKRRQTEVLKGTGQWDTMLQGPQQRRRRMTMETAYMKNNMGTVDKVRGGNGRWTITEKEMR